MTPEPAPQPERCFYAVLGVEREASEQQIRKQYKRLAVTYHPDKHIDNPEGMLCPCTLQCVAFAYISFAEDEI